MKTHSNGRLPQTIGNGIPQEPLLDLPQQLNLNVWDQTKKTSKRGTSLQPLILSSLKKYI